MPSVTVWKAFITITGGKLMTYRLMAEWATDAVCRKLGNNTTPCTTAEAPPPGSQEPTESTLQKIISLPTPLRGSAVYRHAIAPRPAYDSRQHRSPSANVKPSLPVEVKYAVERAVNTLLDPRCRTRIGMGPVRGELCACCALPACYSALTSPRPRSR